MARSFTVKQLLDRGKQASDMENQSFISDGEWKTMLSTAYAELYSILVESGMRYFESSQTITSDGTHSYALPADFLAIIGVDYEVNGNTNERRPLQALMVQERNAFSGPSGAGESTAYSLTGNNIRLYPTPSSGKVYYNIYVPQPVDHSGSADGVVIDVVTPDGEAFVTWHMAFRALAKEESDVSVAMSEREAARERVYNWAVMRALNEPRRVINQQTINGGGYPYDPSDYWGRGGGF